MCKNKPGIDILNKIDYRTNNITEVKGVIKIK